MSRKTKKQKLAAEKRHQFSSGIVTPVINTVSSKTPGDSTQDKSAVSGITFSVPKAAIAIQTQAQSSTSDYSYVLSDLKRILILTALAFCAQVVLWYILK